MTTPSPLMTAAEMAAYTWAKGVASTSSAARNARTLARYIDRLEPLAHYAQKPEPDMVSAAGPEAGYLLNRTLREWLKINPDGFTVRADGQIEAPTDEALVVIIPRSRYVFQVDPPSRAAELEQEHVKFRNEVEAELDRIRPTLDHVEQQSAELVRRLAETYRRLAEARRVAGELCIEIEKLPASERQTKVSLMASGLRQGLG